MTRKYEVSFTMDSVRSMDGTRYSRDAFHLRVARMQQPLQLHLLNHQLQDSLRAFLDQNSLRSKKLDRSREYCHKRRRNGFTTKECALVQ